MRLHCIIPLVFVVVLGRCALADDSRKDDGRKVVIPFDFVSKFDNGRYGKIVGEMIWKKLDRRGGFVIPESMLDVRDTVASNRIGPTPEMPIDKVKKIVRKQFGADIGIWGSVERVSGNRWDVYDLKIRCVDFSAGKKPKIIYQCNTRTKTVSEIPHLYVKQMLDALCGREPGGPPPIDQLAEENWKKNPNLAVGGDFQSGVGGVPKGWDSRGGQLREPLGNLVQWVPEVGDTGNRIIRFTFDKALGDTFGVMYYSDFFPVEEGAKYRFQCRWRSNGPKAKVFIKCYDEVGSEYHGRSKSAPVRPRAKPAAPGRKIAPARKIYVPETGQRRECYRSQQNLKGPKDTWNVQTEDFSPKHTKYTPRWGRVMLYAYLDEGVVEFDDVVVKQIVPPSPGEHAKQRRHSMESDVTDEEIKENERRGRK